jgi:DNA repair exonuclease SbcCD nuclease subunit
MKVLWIGDLHLKTSDLQEQNDVLTQLKALISSENPERVILAGDQFDTFGVIRSEILAAWARFFRYIGTDLNITVIALVGNHDLAGADGGANAMEAFSEYPNVHIVDKWLQGSTFTGETGDIQYLPFIRSKEEFEAKCNELPANSILFCHQSFNGAQFENGFYDPHGADPSCVKHLKAVISGHVHKQQKFENIFYPGTPRQLTFSDAGETKAVYSMSLSNEGYTVTKAHVLDLPQYIVYEAQDVPALLAMLESLNLRKEKIFANCHVKLIAKGTPSEIAQFWQEPTVLEFKTKAKRVVDALTSMKPITAFTQVKGQTQSEKLNGFITERKWRCETEQLIKRAAELLTT